MFRDNNTYTTQGLCVKYCRNTWTSFERHDVMIVINNFPSNKI